MITANQTSSDPAELDALIALALAEHQAGRLVEAAAAYRQILTIRPDIAEAHNNLGDVLLGQGMLDEAVGHYEQAVTLKPDFAEAHNNLGFGYQWQRRLDEAATLFERAVALKPDLFQAHNNLGNVLRDQGKLDQAAERYQQAIALRPDFADARYNLGTVLASQGKLDEAAIEFQHVVILLPEHADAHYILGNLFKDQGRLEEGTAHYERAAALRPESAEMHDSLGTALANLGRVDEATVAFERAAALMPEHAVAHYNLGTALADQGRLDEAAVAFNRAVALMPNHAGAHYNLGTLLKDQGKLDEATVHFEQAATLKPDLFQAHNNLGNMLLNQGRIDEARARFTQALALQPDCAEVESNLGICNLVRGDFERGWPAYEARLRMPGFVPPPGIPRWAGESLAGHTLMLVAEQGLGDTIHFVRYARLLKERGARVVLAVQPALERLLASYPYADALYLVGSDAALPPCDFYLPLMSTPAALGTTVSTIPANVPYLAADPQLTTAWRKELAGIDGFKIGIAWQGSRSYATDHWRSIPLARFAPLARLPGVKLIGLQKGFGSEQIALVDFPVIDLSARLDEVTGPFMDTAAVIRNLDLVVTPNTAISHLAGALGAPVWLALDFAPDWRWLLGRDDSPWYPTMRIFRQTKLGQWTDVFERMAKAVKPRHTETETFLL